MTNKPSEGVLSGLAKSAKNFPILKSTSLSVLLLLGACGDDEKGTYESIKKVSESTNENIVTERDSVRNASNKVKIEVGRKTIEQLMQEDLERDKKKLWNNYHTKNWLGYGAIRKSLWFIEKNHKEEDGYKVLRSISQDIINENDYLNRLDTILTIRYKINKTIGELKEDNKEGKYDIAIQTLTDIHDSLNVLGTEEEDYQTVIAYLHSIKSWTEGGNNTGFNLVDHCAEYLSKYPESIYCDSYVADIRKKLNSKNTRSNKESLVNMDQKFVKYFMGDDSGRNEAVGKYISFTDKNDSIEQIETKVKKRQISARIEKSYELMKFTSGENNVLLTLLENYQNYNLRDFIITELERLVKEIDTLEKYDYESLSNQSRSRMKHFLNEYIKTNGPDQDLVRIEKSITS